MGDKWLSWTVSGWERPLMVDPVADLFRFTQATGNTNIGSLHSLSLRTMIEILQVKHIDL